jgi:hypothetical protein
MRRSAATRRRSEAIPGAQARDGDDDHRSPSDAMAEKRGDVFIMGEGLYQGAYKAAQDCCKNRRQARHRYPDHRTALPASASVRRWLG